MRYTAGMQRKRRLGGVEREILEDLSAGDLLVGFLCSGRSRKRMYKVARERAQSRYRIKKAIRTLTEKGLVRQQGERLSITEAGTIALERTIRAVRNSLTSKRWDRKWRIVSFDIPEHTKELRHEIRSILKRAGFIRLQNSVWIFPHDCRELSGLLRNNKETRKYVLYGVLESIDDDEWLKKHFFLRNSSTIAP